ncbi:MAG: hypothetical protein KDK08_27285 [Rhizobiaceae bacterium]|nr:hypothetical protein [Rhizobiaceae bacterium]
MAVLICVSWVAASVFFVSSAGKSPDAAGAAGVQGSLSVLLDGRSVTSDQYRIVESNGSQSSMRIEVLKTVSVEIFERKRISIDDYIIIIYGLFVALLIACLPFFVRRSIVSGRNSPKRILGARSRSRNRGHDALSSIEEATTVIGSEHDISAIEFDAFKKESEELYINGRKKYDEVISTQAESWLHEHHGQYIVVGVVDDSWAVGANAKSASENYDSQYGSGTGQTVIFKIGDPDDLLRAW